MAFLTNISIRSVQNLLEDLEAGDILSATAQLDHLTQLRSHELYKELESLSQNLSGTLDQVEDLELMQQLKHDLPDVAERLDYVISSTEEASSKTLESSEDLVTILGQLASFQQNLPAESQEEFSSLLNSASNQVTNIMLSQSYQDLTGQVLTRIKLVMGSFEQSLQSLVKRAGKDLSEIATRSGSDEKDDLQQGVGPNVTKKSKQDALEDQADIDDLLADLGI